MGLLDDILALGLDKSYNKFVVQLEPVLQAMSRRGIPVSPVEHKRVTAELERELARVESEMQVLVPDEAKKLTKWKKKQNVRLPFKPSAQQLLNYMRFKHHPVPRAFKTDRETTAELELKRLAKSTKDLLYEKVIEYRELQTLLRNHVANWAPCDADAKLGRWVHHAARTGCTGGRVHPTFYYETGTGQLGARRPNSMNAPKHKANQGDIFRSMIVAKEGHTLVELDYKAFHVQTLAFEARDPDLLRLGKLDIHSFLTAHFLRLGDADRLVGLSNEDLGRRLAAIKREHKHTRDAKVKHALLGYNNGMGYRKCYYQYMEFFENQNESKRVFELLDSLFPKAKAYRQRICDQAHQRGFLISRFGCIRWFWEVYKWSGGKWAFGEDHEAALSFFTQNDAHCHLKEAMLRCRLNGTDERYRLINPIHDALMFECPDKLLAEAVPAIAAEMERPSEVLVDAEVAPGGLAVEVGVSVGKSWNKMIEVDWRKYADNAHTHRA